MNHNVRTSLSSKYAGVQNPCSSCLCGHNIENKDVILINSVSVCLQLERSAGKQTILPDILILHYIFSSTASTPFANYQSTNDIHFSFSFIRINDNTFLENDFVFDRLWLHWSISFSTIDSYRVLYLFIFPVAHFCSFSNY